MNDHEMYLFSLFLEAVRLDAQEKASQLAFLMASGLTQEQAEAEWKDIQETEAANRNPWNQVYHANW